MSVKFILIYMSEEKKLNNIIPEMILWTEMTQNTLEE